MISLNARLLRVSVLYCCFNLLGMCLPGSSYQAAYGAQRAPAKEIEAAGKLVKDHRYLQADALLLVLKKKYPSDAGLAMVRGDLLREIGQLEEASHEFARAAELDAANPLPLVALAQLSLKQMELERSLTYAQQAVCRNPRCLPARLGLVDVLLQCGQTAEAERQLKGIRANFHPNADIELLAYRLSLKKGDLTGARSHLGQAIGAAGSNKLQLQLEDSDLLQTIGDNGAARAELEKIIVNDPDSLSARLRLSRLLETQYHDYASALTNYDEALRIDPLSAQAIAGHDRCQLKRRNIALQIKMALREFLSGVFGQNNAPPDSTAAH